MVVAMSDDALLNRKAERAEFTLNTKLTLTSQRLAMGSDTLEEVQCMKNWVRRGVVTLGSLFFGAKGAI
jgi:hypothetical protein